MRCGVFDGLDVEDKDRFNKMVTTIQPYLPVDDELE